MSDPTARSKSGSKADSAARGVRSEVDKLVPIIYDEIRRIAHHRLRAEQTGHTLQTTALVHEAYMRLAASEQLAFESRAHFLALAAQAMRHVLIDSAATRNTQKRGGGQRPISLDAMPIVAEERSAELLALDEAMRRLSVFNQRQARVAQSRARGLVAGATRMRMRHPSCGGMKQLARATGSRTPKATAEWGS